jgi:HK97 family phage portal protein
MGIATWLGQRFGLGQRHIAGSESWLPTPSLAGVIVDSETVTTLGSYYSGVYVLASDLAAIPFQVVKRSTGGVREVDFSHRYHDLVVHGPNEELDAVGFFQAIMWHLLTRGNAYIEIERDAYLRPVQLFLLDPYKVLPQRSTVDGRLYYLVEGEPRLAADILHIANVGSDGIVGVNPIAKCRETLGLSMGVEKFGASYFGNGIHQKGILTTAQKYDETAQKAMRKEINQEHQGPYNANKFMFLWNGLTFTPTTIPPEDAQFLATRAFQVEEICRILNLPPTKLQAWDKANFASLEEANSNYYQSSLLPWVRRIESQFNRKLFTREERKVWSIEHDTSASLRGRIIDQANADKILRDMGALNTDEIRAKRGLGPVPGGQTYFVPLNFAPLDKVAAASIETLKGMEPKPKPVDPSAPPPDVPTDGIDVPVTVADGAIANAVRAVVLDSATRMVRREVNMLRNFTKRTNVNRSDFKHVLAHLDGHYSDDARKLAEALTPAMAAYSAVSKRSIDLKACTGEISRRSQDEIRTIIEGPDSMANLARLADRWEAEKPAQIVAALT